MDRREVNFEHSFEVNFFDEKEKKVEPINHNTGSPEEKPTIKVSAPALTVGADTSNSPTETVTSACAGLGGLFACLNDDELIDDQTQTDGGSKHIKVNDDDDIKTAATSPLDTTQDSSSSGVNSSEADNSNADAKKSDGRQGKYVSSMENLSTNLTSKANELDELDTHLLNWQCKAARRRFIAYRLGHGRFAMADSQATDAQHKESADDGVLCETGRTSEASGVGPK